MQKNTILKIIHFYYTMLLTSLLNYAIIISTKEHKKQTTGTARTTQHNEDIGERITINWKILVPGQNKKAGCTLPRQTASTKLKRKATTL